MPFRYFLLASFIRSFNRTRGERYNIKLSYTKKKSHRHHTKMMCQLAEHTTKNNEPEGKEGERRNSLTFMSNRLSKQAAETRAIARSVSCENTWKLLLLWKFHFIKKHLHRAFLGSSNTLLMFNFLANRSIKYFFSRFFLRSHSTINLPCWTERNELFERDLAQGV